jgi:hypothetical protein
MKPVFFIVPVLAIVLNWCYPDYKYLYGTFPENPVNMEDFNSEFDDYNSTSPILGGVSHLCFSTNRNSAGKDFDIIYKMLGVTMSKTTGILTVSTSTRIGNFIYVSNAGLIYAVSIINTSYNELGPYLIPVYGGREFQGTGYQSYDKAIFLYASDDPGNLDIRFTQNLSGGKYASPKNIVFLNTDKNDAYPTLNSDNSAIYFCSDRDGDFDIYKAEINKTGSLLEILSDSASTTITRETILLSDYSDKCPFITGNLILFASDRPGGYGRFDLYYSTFKDGKWTSPVNFGEKINTEYDEYRPIVKTYRDEFTNDLMIFSSNRPGGKGGFDLYYVGIDDMTK